MTERLADSEREVLLAVSHEFVKEPTAVAAYGSKIAGYAREDSDYDLIVTAPKFSGRVRYKYVEEPVRASALVVEDDLLIGDASRASLGEFVAGRLLNVYEPLLNDEFLREAEVESKRRIMAELLWELSSQYGELTQDILIPLDYFLFEKLHKRAMVYPPALYSYVHTYTCALAEENRKFSVAGFREAASDLERQGFLRTEGDVVRVNGERLKGRAFSRMLALLNLTTRGMKQYAVHGYAGRVGFSVFKDEAFSKVRRMQDRVEPPEELDHPKRMLSLDDSLTLTKTGEMTEKLAELEGLRYYKRKERSLGEVYSTAKVVTLSGSSEVNYVFKHFADIRSMKWALLNIWSLSRKFSLSPYARMHREYYASKKLKEAGLATPRIVGAVLDDKVLVKEFVEGEPLSRHVEDVLKGRSESTSVIRRYGTVLGRVHAAGLALGDAKASNIIIRGSQLYITDLEQALEGGDQAWDVAEFLYYSGKFSLREEGLRRVAQAFLDGYVEANGKENVAKAKGQKYLAPFRPFVTPQILKAVRAALEDHS